MMIKKDRILVKKKSLLFVEYHGENRCMNCFCSQFEEDYCKGMKCTSEERKDHKTGFFLMVDGALSCTDPKDVIGRRK